MHSPLLTPPPPLQMSGRVPCCPSTLVSTSSPVFFLLQDYSQPEETPAGTAGQNHGNRFPPPQLRTAGTFSPHEHAGKSRFPCIYLLHAVPKLLGDLGVTARREDSSKSSLSLGSYSESQIVDVEEPTFLQGITLQESSQGSSF
jgi:hypothetical protein